MKNKNLKKKTIRLTAGVVALTTLAPLVNPIIPIFSNINQNKALAADEENGRVIYTNPNPNGIKDAQGSINNAISKIEIIEKTENKPVMLKISFADDIPINANDFILFEDSGRSATHSTDIYFKSINVGRISADLKTGYRPTEPRFLDENHPSNILNYTKSNSWEEYLEKLKKFKESDDNFQNGKLKITFKKEFEQFNKNRYIQISFVKNDQGDQSFYYKNSEINDPDIRNKIAFQIIKDYKITLPDGNVISLNIPSKFKTGIGGNINPKTERDINFYGAGIGDGRLNSLPFEIQYESNFVGSVFFDEFKSGTLLKESEIGKPFLKKGSILKFKFENSMATRDYLKYKVGDVIQEELTGSEDPETFSPAFINNSTTPLYVRNWQNIITKKNINLKVIKNTPDEYQLELLEDVNTLGKYKNTLRISSISNKDLKSNFMDIIGKDKYINFIQDKNLVSITNENSKFTVSIIKPGMDEEILTTKIGEKLTKKLNVAYGESTRGTVKVKYIDEKTGKELKSIDTIHENQLWKTIYNITPPKIPMYNFSSANYPLKGIVGEGEKTITLRYKSISEDDLAKITVNYVDEAGNKLQDPTTILKEKGEEYNIDKPIIQNYVFKESSKPLTGTIQENTEINLVYKKGTQTLTVKHIDIDTGAEIADKVSDSKEIGYKYRISPLQHEKYDYVEASESLTGNLDTDKEITLKYRKKSKTITVNYVDEQGNKIKDSSSITKKIDEEYTIEKPEIQNYTFKSSSKPLTGTITDNGEINLVYSKNQFSLTVKHIDIDTGAEIADKVSETKEVGYNYTITPLQHEKYDYVESSEGLTGSLESNKEITLKYRKKSKTITVNYVDEQGNKIKDPGSITKKIDEEYNIEKPEIQNYTFKSSSKPLTGTITDNDEITLTYSKDEHTLTIKYINRTKNGEVEIKESRTEKLTFDKNYTIDKPEIKGYEFKESDSDLTGRLTENKVVKLYYSKYIPGPEGDKGEPGDKGQPGDKGDKGESGKDNGGAPGRESETPDIRIDPKTGNWIVNGKDTGISVFVKNGKDGKDGKDGNTDYNKVYIHYVDYDGNKTKDSESIDKNKLQDKLKEQNPQIAKEKDGQIIVVDKDKDKNKDNQKADQIIKYNIVSDKGEELLASIYLPSKAEKPKPEIKGYKYLKTEKVSDTEERVVYTKDGEKSKDQITGDITYRLVDENNKPITTVYYQNDKFQPELDGYVFKEKIKVSDKEYILVYNKTKAEVKDTEAKDKDTANKNKEINNSTDKDLSTKLKSIIKDEDGNILDTQELEKGVHPVIEGYKYKETKEINKETQELIYTKDKAELKKADVKTGIENVSGSLIALFGTLITGGLALMFKRKTK